MLLPPSSCYCFLFLLHLTFPPSHGVECDYWSLGILAFEMFHGASPFTDLEVLHLLPHHFT